MKIKLFHSPVILFFLLILIINYKTNATEINKNKASAYFKKGFNLSTKGDFKKAIDFFTKAIEIEENYIYYHERGIAFLNLNEFDKALNDFNLSINFGNDPETYANRGYCYASLGKVDLAISDYTTAIEIDPKCINAYSNRGLAYLSKKMYNEAITDYNTIIELDSKNYIAYINRGLVYKKIGNITLSNKDFDMALKLFPQWKKIIEDFRNK